MNKILVIEDDLTIREVILEILSAENFQSIAAENGGIGVQLAEQYVPDLIICDVMMPEMNGHQVLTQLRQNPSTSTIPFIFLTAKTNKLDLRRAMELGADDYLTKPFTHKELLGAINSRLEKQAAINKQTQRKIDGLRQSLSISLPHELLLSLNNISDLSKTLIEKYDTIQPATIWEVGQQIKSSTQSLHRLINNFLLHAELELAATNPENIKTLISRGIIPSKAVIADAAIKQATQASREADLHLELADAPVQMSTADLYKIVEEIINNAFKFSLAGTSVNVSSTIEDDVLVLQVGDSGRGMTAEQIYSIGADTQFEQKVYEQKGSGLGLSIVKRIAEFYGGRLILISNPQRGTIVRVTIPSAT